MIDLKGKSVHDSKSTMLPEWKKNFVIGIDDCICITKKNGSSLTVKDVAKAVEVNGARDWVNERFEQGHAICFLTTRKEKLRSATERWLKQHGFKYHSLIMKKPLAQEYHYIDDRHVQATTFRGRFAPLVKKEHEIQVFS